jgi:hypothetical protein
MNRILPAPAALLLLATGCGDLFSGSRVGTGNASSSAETQVAVLTVRPAQALRFPGDSDAVLALDTTDFPGSFPPSLWTDSVVIAAWSLDSTRSAWIADSVARGDVAWSNVHRAVIVLQHPPGATSIDIALPGTGLGAAGKIVDSSRTRFSIRTPEVSWTLAIRARHAESSAVWMLDSVPLGGDLSLDIAPLLLAPSGCRARLGSGGRIEETPSGQAVCAP